MNWNLVYLSDALDDLKLLDGSVRPIVVKGIQKVLKNPLPQSGDFLVFKQKIKFFFHAPPA